MNGHFTTEKKTKQQDKFIRDVKDKNKGNLREDIQGKVKEKVEKDVKLKVETVKNKFIEENNYIGFNNINKCEIVKSCRE